MYTHAYTKTLTQKYIYIYIYKSFPLSLCFSVSTYPKIR